MDRILRSYDERGHEKAVEIELEKLTDAQKFLHSKNALGGFDTIEETSEYLNAKTGWPIIHAPRSITAVAPQCIQAGILATLALLQGEHAEQFLTEQDITFWARR